MEHALAVVEGDEAAKDIVREAGELAAATGADLVLVHVTDEGEYDRQREQMESVTTRETQYSVGQALEGARKFADDVGAAVLGDLDVSYEAVGRLGEKGEEVLSVAADRDVDHIFIAGQKRSPTGKAVFGDVTQEVILDFDGAVTVVTV
jgi:nucleotide-binding universal stress UspA family protein